MTYKTRGIILKRTNLGEADRILTIFSEKKGKIKVLAKGVRKTLSHLAGHLEPFCLADFVIVEGKTFDIVTGAVVQKCFFKLRHNLDSTHTSYYLAEIIDKMVEEGEPHKEILDLLEEVLENLNDGATKLVLVYFTFNLLSELGYHPELNKCIRCGKVVKIEKIFFSVRSGGLVCEYCTQNDLKISPELVKILRLSLKHKLKIIKKIQANSKLIKEVETLSENYLVNIHQQEFKSRRYLKV